MPDNWSTLIQPLCSQVASLVKVVLCNCSLNCALQYIYLKYILRLMITSKHGLIREVSLKSILSKILP